MMRYFNKKYNSGTLVVVPLLLGLGGRNSAIFSSSSTHALSFGTISTRQSPNKSFIRESSIRRRQYQMYQGDMENSQSDKGRISPQHFLYRTRRFSSSSQDQYQKEERGDGRTKRVSSKNKPNAVEDALINAEEEARKRRTGQAKHRLQKATSREDRISSLELKSAEASKGAAIMTDAEKAELKGLLLKRESFEEQYNVGAFTKEHLEFKKMHNDIFIALARYCEEERDRISESKSSDVSKEPINLFYLDGPDGGTTNALLDNGGFDASQCYVANRHKSSCDVLKISGGGRLPDENVVHATAAEAFTVGVPVALNASGERINAPKDNIQSESGGPFSETPFTAYYFDGCGGFVPHVIGMMSASLIREDISSPNRENASIAPIAVGYSLLGGNKDVVEKELQISQALTIIARRRGMRIVHALDDPVRYGLATDVKKIGGSGGGGTFTSWILLEADDRPPV